MRRDFLVFKTVYEREVSSYKLQASNYLSVKIKNNRVALRCVALRCVALRCVALRRVA